MTTKWTSTALPGSGSTPQDTLGEQSVVLLLYGKNSFGDKIFSYLKVTLANLQKLKMAINAAQGFNPSDFGEVISAGRGEPTDAVRAEVASMYQVLDSQKPAQSAAPLPASEKKAWDEY